MDERHREFRARALSAVAILGFAILLSQLFWMQGLRHEVFAQRAQSNRQYQRRVLAPRGMISDRNGIDLAHNEYQARITYPRRLAVPGDSTLTRVIELLDLDPDLVFERIRRAPPGDRVTLLRRATSAQVAVVEEHRPLLPNVRLTVEARREYRFASLATHVMGYVGEVRQEEVEESRRKAKLDDRPTFYESGDVIGRQGIEAVEEPGLRGQHGSRIVMVNAAGHEVGELSEASLAATAGVHIYLALHQGLQGRLEQLLDGRVGAGVVLEVATGDVLATASAPTYDPNEFIRGISQERYDQIQGDARKPLFNRALHGVYPPGSPFKLITAAAALERGYVDPRERFEPCHGGYQYGNRWFGCWDPAGHGALNLQDAIVQSCDTYFYQLAQRLTVDELAETAHRFGLGSTTNLAPLDDRAGLVPDEAWYNRRMGVGGWTKGVMLNLAIGQGELLATPLQMARAFAAIGGDGHLYRPQLVLARQVVHGPRNVRNVERSTERICSPSTQRFLQRSLRQVVEGKEGTGGLAQVDGYPVAGKTGTAENPFGEDHAWFVAYAPADAPEIAVALIVENSGHGGSVAAPLVGELLHTYFSLSRGAVIEEASR